MTTSVDVGGAAEKGSDTRTEVYPIVLEGWRPTGPDLWILEDTSSYADVVENGNGRSIAVRLYRLSPSGLSLEAEISYPSGSLRGSRSAKAEIALTLLGSKVEPANGIVVATHRCGGGGSLAQLLTKHGYSFVLEIPSGGRIRSLRPGRPPKDPSAAAKLERADWRPVDVRPPESAAKYNGASIGQIEYGGVEPLQCFAISSGGIDGYSRGLLVGVSSLEADEEIEDLGHFLGWCRWLRPVVRRAEREARSCNGPAEGSAEGIGEPPLIQLDSRPNLRIARRLDEQVAALPPENGQASLRGALGKGREDLNVVELFAGAGGMGLGFLLSEGEPQYRIVVSTDIHPVYTETLRTNHSYAVQESLVGTNAVTAEVETMDLREPASLDAVAEAATAAGQVDVLIGGPPCQGFSSANRNSWSAKNPNNQLVDTFIDYVERLNPRVLVMENVQGILWTPRAEDQGADDLSVAHHVAQRLSDAGYDVYAKLLDAAWFGVPQHRNRFFLIGLHKDLGYKKGDFGEWGPFPEPTHGPGRPRRFVTVRDAIADLPPVENGSRLAEVPYAGVRATGNRLLAYYRRGAPAGVIWDHITSRHADYVIERYRAIPPGGNWEDVAEMMTNYADVDRTHSNIYRRLEWDSASITIGHYRKSMIVHPEQHRGLSLREAARLQGFPDWFRFAGSPTGLNGGLTHKQQQLANAVCPPVTKAVAEYLAAL